MITGSENGRKRARETAMKENKKKHISTGYEDFKELIDENCYFVDKTLLIQEVLCNKTKAMLITRPRRFGKTLNLSILRRFFEDERTAQGEKIDNGYLFDGLAVSRCGEEVLQHRQQYPVIFLSLKSAKQPDYEMAYDSLIDEIAREFSRHQYVLLSNALSEAEKERFTKIRDWKAKPVQYAASLAFLSECLAKYHGKNAIILIDEYDVPLENAYFENFYEEMITFIRSLFESALKTNPNLERGIITGCLRISRESIFTGLNNLAVHSPLSNHFDCRFGFTEAEVREMLAYYKLEGEYPQLQQWYDGYLFGCTEIYNPWSILNYIYNTGEGNNLPRPYWSNTSGNSIVRELVEHADGETKMDLEVLMQGETIEKPVHEEITYEDIHATKDNLWNFLFFTGYLKAGKQRMEDGIIYMELSIPNLEIKTVYRNSIVTWFDEKIRKMDRSLLIKALEEGDCRTAETFISRQLMEGISYNDYAESYYHGFLTGLLLNAGAYRVCSNREAGTGRADLILTEQKFRGKAMVLELKVAEKIGDMEKKCEEALAQIEEKQYMQPLEEEGFNPVLKYGICFFKKGCAVQKA